MASAALCASIAPPLTVSPSAHTLSISLITSTDTQTIVASQWNHASRRLESGKQELAVEGHRRQSGCGQGRLWASRTPGIMPGAGGESEVGGYSSSCPPFFQLKLYSWHCLLWRLLVMCGYLILDLNSLK